MTVIILVLNRHRHNVNIETTGFYLQQPQYSFAKSANTFIRAWLEVETRPKGLLDPEEVKGDLVKKLIEMID